MNINDWASTDRPREKMMANGPEALTDTELLAILINTGHSGQTAVDIARTILSRCHNNIVEFAHTIMRNGNADNKDIKGLGPAKSCHIKAAIELGKRIARAEEQSRSSAIVVNSSQAVFAQFNTVLSSLDHEQLWALYMSKNGKTLAKYCISIGGVDATCADLRKISQHAIEHMASYVALCHNHPHSGIKPSIPDKELTKKAKEALALFDVRLIDHLIISDGKYYSFADNGDI